MIKNITVHPKSATHVQILAGSVYFLTQIEGEWFFRSLQMCSWLKDTIMNDVTNISYDCSKQHLKKIGEVNVNIDCTSSMPPVGVPSDYEVIF